MTEALGFQPLYKQVYDRLVLRISRGDWKPAESLPSEHALAAELGVSQGTVRKALNELEAEKLVERRQGKGTFVTEHTSELANFRFFRLARPDGTRLSPDAKLESISRRAAKRGEKVALELTDKAQVIEIRRIRIVDDAPCVAEIVVLPYGLYPGIERLDSLGGSLYPLYQREYGIHIVSADEKISSVVATKENAKRLSISAGTPLLRVDRIAFSVNKRPVEWRTSFCDTRNFVYSVSVT